MEKFSLEVMKICPLKTFGVKDIEVYSYHVR